MTFMKFKNIEKITEYSSIAAGLVLGLVYLNPMTVNSVKNDLKSSVASISVQQTQPEYANLSVENISEKKLAAKAKHIILASN